MTQLGITLASGTYFSPWTAYTISSIYDAVDQIVISNHGYNLADKGLSMGPLKEVSDCISHLDRDMKIVELIDTDINPLKLRHSYPLDTQKAANARRSTPEGEGLWYDVRGLNITAAHEKAIDLKADWILKIDTDQVCFADVLALGDAQRRREILYEAWSLYQSEFMGDIGPKIPNHLSNPPPASPYIDTVYIYPADKKTWYMGAGAISDMYYQRMECEFLHCAHLRSANPWWLSREAKLKHFYERRCWQLYTNDYGTWEDERLWEEAMRDAKTTLDNPKIGKTFTKEPPEACMLQDPLEYIRDKQGVKT